MASKVTVHLALITVSLIFGTNYVFSKIILGHISPKFWTFYRAFIASLTLLPFIDWSAFKRILRLRRAWIAGLLGIALNQALFTEGLRLTTPAHSALINACIPAATLLFSIAAKREQHYWQKSAGIFVAVIGVIMLILSKQPDPVVAKSIFAGNALTIANVCAFSLFLVVGQPVAKEHHIMTVTAFYFMESTLFLLILLTFHYTWVDPQLRVSDFTAMRDASLRFHLLLISVAVVASTIAYALNNWSLRRATPSMVAAYITLQPLIAAITNFALRGEPVSNSFFVAFVLVSVGVWAAVRKKTVAYSPKS